MIFLHIPLLFSPLGAQEWIDGKILEKAIIPIVVQGV